MTLEMLRESAPEATTGRYALLADGGSVLIRCARPDDVDDVRTLFAGLSQASSYLRFHGAGAVDPSTAAATACRETDTTHGTLLALTGQGVVGVAQYEQGDEPGDAEVAVAVADRAQNRGVGTLLVEHLAAAARASGFRRLCADMLGRNAPMHQLLDDMGFPVSVRAEGDVVHVSVAVEPEARFLEAVADRDRHAGVASLVPLFRPRSVAVFGASRRTRSVGRAVLRNLLHHGFAGPVYPVNPNARVLDGLVVHSSIADLPESPDLAVLAVPGAAVLPVAQECGARGVRALVVLAADVPAAELHDLARRYGMRVVGPNSLGVMNTAVGLDATFAGTRPRPGRVGVVTQSGGVGTAVLERLARLRIGVSTFASIGDRCDVSSNDLLQWWLDDPETQAAVLHLESFGNPRRFVASARRVARHKPVLAVMPGRTAPGRGAVRGHTGGAVLPAPLREAVMEAAGVVPAETLSELVGTLVLLLNQPRPEGPRVLVVSNAAGAGVLAADECASAGLELPEPSEALLRRLGEVLPRGSHAANPIDATPVADTAVLRRVLAAVGQSGEFDSVLVLLAPTSLGDLRAAVGSGVRGMTTLAVALGQEAGVALRRGPSGSSTVPIYANPEDAARALADVTRYSAWQRRADEVPTPAMSPRMARARRVVREALAAARPEGGPLTPSATAALARALGVEPMPAQPASGNADGWHGRRVRLSAGQHPDVGPCVCVGGRYRDLDGNESTTVRLAPFGSAEATVLAARARETATGRPLSDEDASRLADLALRVSRLMVLIPEVAEIDLDPLVLSGDTLAAAVTARIAPVASTDSWLRALP